MSNIPLVYVSQQCPNCIRLLDTIQRLQLRIRIIDIDVQAPRHQISVVPTVITEQGRTKTGTDAFEWLQAFEAEVPLDAYATVTGEGEGGLPYTDMESNQTEHASNFTSF
jgi:hypothetical protein